MYSERIRYVCPSNGVEVPCLGEGRDRCKTPHQHQVEELRRHYDPIPVCPTHHVLLIEADVIDLSAAA